MANLNMNVIHSFDINFMIAEYPWWYLIRSSPEVRNGQLASYRLTAPLKTHEVGLFELNALSLNKC